MELRAGLNHGVLSMSICSPQTHNNGTCFCGLLKAVNKETFVGLEGMAHTSLTLRKQSLQIEVSIGRCILGVQAWSCPPRSTQHTSRDGGKVWTQSREHLGFPR